MITRILKHAKYRLRTFNMFKVIKLNKVRRIFFYPPDIYNKNGHMVKLRLVSVGFRISTCIPKFNGRNVTSTAKNHEFPIYD